MGQKIAEKFKDDWIPSNFFVRLIVLPFSFKLKTIDTMIKVIKSPWVYINLRTRLLRDGFLVMIAEITYLINECLRSSITQWKVGIITTSSNPGDWMPVSVLLFPSKIIEKFKPSASISF